MEEKDITREEDLIIAKKFLDNMLSPLNSEERKRLLELLLKITE